MAHELKKGQTIGPRAFRTQLPTKIVQKIRPGALWARFWRVLEAFWASLWRALGVLGRLLAALGHLLGAALEIPPFQYVAMMATLRCN